MIDRYLFYQQKKAKDTAGKSDGLLKKLCMYVCVWAGENTREV